MKTLNIEGTYKLSNDLLVKDGLTLKLGQRHRPKKGQAKRFIGAIDPSKPEADQYSYISSLYTIQGTPKFRLEQAGQEYELSVTGINTVVIDKAIKKPVLVFTGSELEGVVS